MYQGFYQGDYERHFCRGSEAVALVNGLVVLLGGSWLGGKLLDARMPKILATLDDFASLQQ